MLLAVASLAMQVSRRHLASYSCPKSKHTFTQPQMMSCLVLKAYLKQSYRGICELLEVSDQLRQTLGLKAVPHYSALKKFADRVNDPALIDALCAQVLKLVLDAKEVVPEVAMDSTGLDPCQASTHFRDRTGRVNKGYVKVAAVVTCTTLLLVSVAITWGPRNDLCEAREILPKALERVRAGYLYADKGYDADWVHQACREPKADAADRTGVTSVIPLAKAPGASGIAGGVYRPLMQQTPLPGRYGRRWHVESFFSGLKRTCGDRLAARLRPALMLEAGLRVLAYALRR